MNTFQFTNNEIISTASIASTGNEDSLLVKQKMKKLWWKTSSTNSADDKIVHRNSMEKSPGSEKSTKTDGKIIV